MKDDVLWDDMLWSVVNTEILGEGTACSFSIQQAWVCNIHEDLNFSLRKKGIV